jgi:type IV pilus biogenesis protein CpaD/CtpE
MMNAQPLRVVDESIIDQMYLSDVNDTTLNNLADYYLNNSTGTLDLTATYDPASKYFGSKSAQHELGHIVEDLNKKGVTNIASSVMAVPGNKPMLIITYESAVVLPPSDCGETPGLKDYQTGRFIGDYKFGCGVETMFAKQISDPNDLYGTDGLGGQSSARRAAIVVEGHASATPNQPLEGVETNERLGQ